jgi:hypothetical protein
MKPRFFACLLLLAACPADDSFTPETLLTQMSAGQLRGICDEEVARRHDELARSRQALDCVIEATTDFDLGTCDSEVLDPCLDALPATTDLEISCSISDRQIEWLQYCQETTAAQFRACLAARIDVDTRLPETECSHLPTLEWEWDEACAAAESRCSALEFEFLLSEPG